ncbi:Uncharacterised protein [Mycobacteroides abscessus]|nr:Uncharacterised protein [Mycobacteroides abscessus]
MPTSATSLSRRSSRTSVATTRAPSASSRSTVARPMPAPAPVTIAVRPSNLPGTWLLTMTAPSVRAGTAVDRRLLPSQRPRARARESRSSSPGRRWSRACGRG